MRNFFLLPCKQRSIYKAIISEVASVWYHLSNSLQSKGDADVLIIEKAIVEVTKEDLDVVAEDTDILILLICHWNQHEDLHEIYFNTELKVCSARVIFLKLL